MSYFMTSSGARTEAIRRELWALIPAAEAPAYVRTRMQSFSENDGAHVYFVDDTRTGTSHGIVCEAEDMMNRGGDFGSTLLGKIVEELLAKDHCIRIWWADNSADAHLKVADCPSQAAAETAIKDQISRTVPVHIRIKTVPAHPTKPLSPSCGGSS